MSRIATSILPVQNLCLVVLPFVLLTLFGISGHAGETTATSLPDVDHKGLVSQADLLYEGPVRSPVEGQPIGNGRMGTLVWTSLKRCIFRSIATMCSP